MQGCCCGGKKAVEFCWRRIRSIRHHYHLSSVDLVLIQLGRSIAKVIVMPNVNEI